MRVETFRGRFGGDQRHEKIERRRVYFFQSRELERRYELRLEFHRPASLVVLQHRGLVRRAGRGRAARPAFWTMRRLVDGDAQGARDGAIALASKPSGSSRLSRASYHQGIPFWTNTTAVSRPRSGAHSAAKAPSRFAFSVTNTASCAPSSRADATARTRPMIVWSPCKSFKPRVCIAARCAPRATTLVSLPAAA